MLTYARYVVEALLRLLSLNLRQIQRHPDIASLPADWPSLRRSLLELVSVTEDSCEWHPVALASVQEEAGMLPYAVVC